MSINNAAASTLSIGTVSSSTAGLTVLNIGTGTYTQSSGSNKILSITPSYNYSSTSSNVDLFINRTDIGSGSGADVYKRQL